MSKQRVVLVTGGMGGLGETITTKMADADYKVVVTYSPGNTKHGEWVADMKTRGYDVLAVACDVASYDSCSEAVAEAQARLGPIDVLVNNAGITRDMTFKKMDKVNWDAVMRTNLDSLFNMTKQVADGMADRGWGRIINVSSVNGSKGAFGQRGNSAQEARRNRPLHPPRGKKAMAIAAEGAHAGLRAARAPALLRKAGAHDHPFPT
jgi:acetoacetyl-CoA reductase